MALKQTKAGPRSSGSPFLIIKIMVEDTVNTVRPFCAGLMLFLCLRHWPSLEPAQGERLVIVSLTLLGVIKPILFQYLVFAGEFLYGYGSVKTYTS